IEGLDGSHPVQLAWIEFDVPQCGYCQSGQIMAAVALLKRIQKPTDADIDAGMDNICRCGTYLRIRQAVHRAAELQAEGGATMGANVAFTPQVELDRRDFLVRSAAVGGAMVLGFYVPPANARTAPIEGQPWYRDAMVPELNAWLTIAPDDTVTIRVAQTEMGTGVFTSCPMMIAEELQCDWSKVRAEYASPRRNFVERAPDWTLQVPGGGDPLIRDGGGEPATSNGDKGVYRRMSTASSGSVRESRYYLQMAGAEARERLLLAAAALWGVPVSELAAKNSVITHVPSGRQTTYGALAAKAGQIALPDPSKIKIKGPDQFTLIGTEQKNLDVPLKVTGKAIYGIDVELPDMVY